MARVFLAARLWFGYGSSFPRGKFDHVEDEDLDRHVAEFVRGQAARYRAQIIAARQRLCDATAAEYNRRAVHFPNFVPAAAAPAPTLDSLAASATEVAAAAGWELAEHRPLPTWSVFDAAENVPTAKAIREVIPTRVPSWIASVLSLRSISESDLSLAARTAYDLHLADLDRRPHVPAQPMPLPALRRAAREVAAALGSSVTSAAATPVPGTAPTPKSDRETERRQKIAAAMLLVQAQPSLSMTAIARQVGVSKSTLSRSPQFQEAARIARTGKPLRRGHLKTDAHTGLRDVEAHDDDPEFEEDGLVR